MGRTTHGVFNEVSRHINVGVPEHATSRCSASASSILGSLPVVLDRAAGTHVVFARDALLLAGQFPGRIGLFVGGPAPGRRWASQCPAGGSAVATESAVETQAVGKRLGS
jgi:hypothetical protein